MFAVMVVVMSIAGGLSVTPLDLLRAAGAPKRVKYRNTCAKYQTVQKGSCNQKLIVVEWV